MFAGEIDLELYSIIQQLLEAVVSCNATSIEISIGKIMQTANDIVNVSSVVIPTVDEKGWFRRKANFLYNE